MRAGAPDARTWVVTGEPETGASAPSSTSHEAEGPRSDSQVPSRSGSERLVSLDVFRGFTILGMLLVNNVMLNEATPRQLTHAPWKGGVHFADLVFPWFLLIVGISMPFATASARKKGVSGWSFAGKVLRRTLSLLFLGCLIDSSLAHRPVFGLGVLQLIGLAYCVASPLVALPLPVRAATAAVLLVGHWAAIRFVPVPGAGAGAFTEDVNLIVYLNRTYLQEYGLKGLLSVIPTSALVLIGTMAGDVLRRDQPRPGRKVGLVAGGGSLLVLAGWLWSLDLPFSKALWTASYILFAGGLGLVLFVALYLFVDLRQWRTWAFPLVVFGSNAILAYVAPILVKIHVLQEWTWKVGDGKTVSLQEALLRGCIQQWGKVPGGWAYTAGYILFWWLVLVVLYRKRLFLRV